MRASQQALHQRIAELEGVVQSHEIVTMQTAERAQALETELKVAREYHDMWEAMAEAQDARAQKAEAKVAELEGIVQSHEIVLSQTAERAQVLEAEVERLQVRDADWQRKAAVWMASSDARQALDGYRDLAAKVAAAEERAEKAEAENANLLGVIEIWQREVAGRDADIDGLRALCAEAADRIRRGWNQHHTMLDLADRLAAAAKETT